MRAIKYLILGILLVSVTKKIYLSDNSLPLPFTMALSQKDAQSSINAIKEPNLSDMVGSYDPITKTATITFHNVVEYNKSVTPPNVMDRKLKLFGAMPTPNQGDSKGSFIRPGGIRPITTLYGIPLLQSNSLSASPPDQENLAQDEKDKGDDLEHYDRASRTAVLKNGKTYVGIVEYSQSVTPPSISNPALKSFATIATPNFVSSNVMTIGIQSHIWAGAKRSQTTLFGLPVSGEKFPVKSKASSIGFYWPESKIVQLNNGETLVCVIEEKKGNYKKTGAHAIGPVYTWFSNDNLKKYGISNMDSDFKSRVENIGTAKIDHSTVILNGVKLSVSNDTESQMPTVIPSHYFNYLEENKRLEDISSREKANSVVTLMNNSLRSSTPCSSMFCHGAPLSILNQQPENK